MTTDGRICYGNRIPSPDKDFHDPARCERTIPPALEMQAHSAPLGITFLDRATMFPADWRGDAVVAFHGSWNRSDADRCEGGSDTDSGWEARIVRGFHYRVAGPERSTLGPPGRRDGVQGWIAAHLGRRRGRDLPRHARGRSLGRPARVAFGRRAGGLLPVVVWRLTRRARCRSSDRARGGADSGRDEHGGFGRSRDPRGGGP